MRVEDKLSTGIWADVLLDGGHDGQRPGAGDYEGEADPARAYALGLRQFEDIEAEGARILDEAQPSVPASGKNEPGSIAQREEKMYGNN